MEKTYTSEADENFFGAIGRLTISWAHLELGLDGAVFEIHRAFGGRDIETELPRSLSRKLAYLRTWVKQIEALGGENADGFLGLLDSIETSSQTRHDLIHGIVTEMEEGSGKAEFKRLLHTGGRPKVREFSMTTVDILRAATEAQRLSGKTLLWARELQKFVSERTQPDALQKPS